MTVFQAALIALFYTFSQSAFSAGLGAYVFSQPLIAGTVVGFLLGDPLGGAAVGAMLNVIALALNPLRLRLGPDLALAGYVGIPFLLLNGIAVEQPQSTLTFGALAAFGMLLTFMRGVLNSVLAHWADYFAERGDATLVAFINLAPSQIWLFIVTFVPAFALLRLDLQAVLSVANALPAWIDNALRLSQHLLAALGIAMGMRLLLRGSGIAYFVLGWLASHLFGPAPLTLFGASIAAVHAFVARKQMERSPDTLADQGRSTSAALPVVTPAPTTLAPADLRVALILWVFFHNAALNFERFQNIGFAAAMAPIARKLYQAVEERAACLRRHLSFFSAEFSTGALLLGATVALEERRANGEAIDEVEMVGAKTGAMAALGVVGEALVQGALMAPAVAVGASLAQQGNLLGPFLFVVFQAALIWSIAYVSFQAGYAHMQRAMNWARLNDWLRAGLFAFTRLGAFVLGGLLLAYVPVGLPPTMIIQIDGSQIALQAIFDRVMPNMIPLAVTVGLWWVLRTRTISPIALLGALIVLSFALSGVLSVLGWL
ncbi:MAG: PTS system mannose/fructose/sorbose family transporter subunit IID [Anaerolineae bacterium]|nr:PTS system mannose/fructose/sorbose family transporter subunit IID [Thermoflexales bacterium]MDW8406728.1 PTS system mannose/fructose/sorbose family transporter subunit IID [Anaerolineae bacterium]